MEETKEQTKARIIAHIERLGLERDATLKAILEGSPSLLILERLEAALAAQAGAPAEKPARKGAPKVERVIDVDPLPARPWLAAFSHAPLPAPPRPIVASVQDELQALRSAPPAPPAAVPPVVSALADELTEACRRWKDEESNG